MIIANYNEWILFNYFQSNKVIGYVRIESKLSEIKTMREWVLDFLNYMK